MNKTVIIKNLEQLIEEHKKEKKPYKTYEFDSDSYTLLLIDINILKNQLEEKDKVTNEAIELINNHNELENELGGTIKFNLVKLLEILERGKNVNNK